MDTTLKESFQKKDLAYRNDIDLPAASPVRFSPSGRAGPSCPDSQTSPPQNFPVQKQEKNIADYSSIPPVCV